MSTMNNAWIGFLLYNVCMDYRKYRGPNDGRSKKRSYRIWQQMRDRCSNPNNPHKKYYSDKGVTVCERWLEPFGKGYDNFLEDMGEPEADQSLDRINVNGNYEPSNCRWASRVVQMNNTTRKKIVKEKGISYDKERGKYTFHFQSKSAGVTIFKRFDTIDEAKAYRLEIWSKYVPDFKQL